MCRANEYSLIVYGESGDRLQQAKPPVNPKCSKPRRRIPSLVSGRNAVTGAQAHWQDTLKCASQVVPAKALHICGPGGAPQALPGDQGLGLPYPGGSPAVGTSSNRWADT